MAVRQAGEETFRICRHCLDEVITVTTDEICAAVKDIFDGTRAVSEPAGGVSLAGLKRYAVRARARGAGPLVAINSGANLNFDRLRHIAERRRDRRRARGAARRDDLPEEAGSYRRFMQVLGPRSITEFNYRQTGPGIPAHIFVGVELRNGEAEKRDILATLDAAGYPVVDLSDDEIAKVHVRHMVGGRVMGLEHERVMRFPVPGISRRAP